MFFPQSSEIINVFVENCNEPQKLCTEINHFICNCFGIPFSIIKFNFEISKNKNWGSCDPQKNIIYITIDKNNSNPFKLCHTIIHETTHLFTSFLIKNNIHINNIENLNEQYYFNKTKSYFRSVNYSKCQYEHFKKSIKNLDITVGFLNLLLIDKISTHYDFSKQPYAYNLDANEMISEVVAQEIMFYISENIKMSDNQLSFFSQYLMKSDFFRNGDVYMKQIYLSENISPNKNVEKNILFLFRKLKHKINLHDIRSYDIEKYIATYQYAQKEYEKKIKEIKGSDGCN